MEIDIDKLNPSSLVEDARMAIVISIVFYALVCAGLLVFRAVIALYTWLYRELRKELIESGVGWRGCWELACDISAWGQRKWIQSYAGGRHMKVDKS